jgi:hypothetical protein
VHRDISRNVGVPCNVVAQRDVALPRHVSAFPVSVAPLVGVVAQHVALPVGSALRVAHL